jgi:hypothetical protein
MIILNIGLLNNPIAVQNLINLYSSNLISYDLKVMSYVDEPEPTLILRLNSLVDLNFLCSFCTQECIPFYDTETKIGQLVFNSNYDGEKFPFDIKFFAM